MPLRQNGARHVDDAAVSYLWRIYIFAPLVYNIKSQRRGSFQRSREGNPRTAGFT